VPGGPTTEMNSGNKLGNGIGDWRMGTGGCGHGDPGRRTPSGSVRRTSLACALWPQVNSLTKCQAYLFIYFCCQADQRRPLPFRPNFPTYHHPNCLYSRPRPTFSSRFASLAKCLFNSPHRVYEKTKWSTNNKVSVWWKGALDAPRSTKLTRPKPPKFLWLA